MEFIRRYEMYWKRTAGITMMLALFTLLVSSGVLADDGRINRAPYHFGGNTLYCTEGAGCTLLDMTGNTLANWPETDIDDAFALLETSGQSVNIGDGQGTYGTAQLWAVPTGEDNGNKKLCLIAFDEWGKQNDMCFAVTLDHHFAQAPLPVSSTAADVADCSMWSVGDFVKVIGQDIWGSITSINAANGTATFGKALKALSIAYTYGCDQIEVAR
jgi:hypothetical protein